jgi:hypothetical protein
MILKSLCVLFMIAAAAAQAAPATVSVSKFPSSSRTAHLVKSIWQPEIDSVISSGTMEVGVVQAKGSLKNDRALEAASEKLARAYAEDLMGKGDELDPSSEVSKFGRSTEDALVEMINSVNDYAPENRAPGESAKARLRATFKRMGYEDTSSLIAVVTRVTVKPAASADSSPGKYFQILILDPKTGIGLSIAGSQGSM